MTPDELPSPPRKASWKRWTLVLACAVAVVTIVSLAIPPKPEPVKVWFVRATNEGGVKRLVFEGTNGVPRQIVFFVYAVIGAIPGGSVTNSASAVVAPGAVSTFTLTAPPTGVSYYVAWGFIDRERANTLWCRARIRCGYFFIAHGMPLLADFLDPAPKVRYIPSSEIKE
jgi:hypothetical protein